MRNLKEKDHLEDIQVKLKESRNKPGVAQRVP
jgi:hypothetical protein